MPASPTDERPFPSSAIVSFTLVWAIELALARVTSQIQSGVDIAVSALVLILLPTAALAAAARLTVTPSLRRIVGGVIAVSPLLLVANGILQPVASNYSGIAVQACATIFFLGLLIENVLSARSGDGPAPSIGMTLGVLMAATASAWVLTPAGFPPFQIHVPFLLCSVLFARLALRPNGLLLLVMAGLAIALWPAVPPPPPWEDKAPDVTRADVVLVTVEREDAVSASDADVFARVRAAGVAGNVRSAESVGPYLAAVLSVSQSPAAGSESLAESFANSGYDTAAVIAAEPALDVPHGFFRGFAAFHHFIDRNRFALPRSRALQQPGEVRDYAARPVAADMLTTMGFLSAPDFASPSDVLRVAAKIMSERRPAPVFLWVHFAGSSAEIDENAAHIVDALEATEDRPHTLVLLATPGPEVGGTPGSFPLVVSPAGALATIAEGAAVLAPSDVQAALRTLVVPPGS